MLVLRPRAGEAILVGEVEIEIIEISRSRVKLGVRAPHHIPVIRKETLKAAQDNLLASDLMASRGREVVGEILKMLKPPDSAAAVPDRIAGDVPQDKPTAAQSQVEAADLTNRHSGSASGCAQPEAATRVQRPPLGLN